MRTLATPIVSTAAGDVAGETVDAPGGGSVRRFLGIPYAAPPVGDLRWRAPLPPDPWPGVRRADRFAPGAPQIGAIETRLPGFSPSGPTSEDCLALNVWTPGLDGSRPVLVWIPGGAYSSGATSQPVYDAARLAADGDLVVVTVGYRLGALGFLAPEGDALANCGLRDQLAALAWVREHASAFGGDPRRVTAMGESAGAGSVLHLVASPARGDAFTQAVAQSGQPTTHARAVAHDVAAEFARALELESADAARLRALPLERVLDAQRATLAALIGRVGPMPFAPSVDDDVCEGGIVDGIAAGRAAGLDGVVLGTTRDELALFPDPRAAELDDDRLVRRVAALGPVIDPASVVAHYRDRLGASAGERRSAEPPDRLAANERVWDAARTDAVMRAPNLRVADALADAGVSTHVYRFDWEAPTLGAAHAVDLPFTFGTFDREGWGPVVGHGERAERLGIEWRAAWSRFAHRGDPGWHGYERDGHHRTTTMVFGIDAVTERDDVDETVARCWLG